VSRSTADRSFRRRLALVGVAALALALLVGCGGGGPPSAEVQAPASSALEPHDTLRDVAAEGVVIGAAAAGGGHYLQTDTPNPFGDDDVYRGVLAAEFSSVTPENQMKWELIHPGRDQYDFAAADAVVAFAEEHGQQVRGHALLWHSQNPAWLEQGDFTPDELREILREHIRTVVGRYAGRVQQWDVANEVLDDTGALRDQENIWLRELGPQVIGDAFRWAHEADPDALLFLNDYGVESPGAKSDAYYDLAQSMLADGVPVDGFGVQGHLSMEYGFPSDLQANLQRFADLGLEIAFTEVDVRMVLPADGVPTPAQLERQADYYRQMLQACLAIQECGSFTLWGVVDTYSWVPSFFPDEGAATVMGPDYVLKPAYQAVRAALSGA